MRSSRRTHRRGERPRKKAREQRALRGRLGAKEQKKRRIRQEKAIIIGVTQVDPRIRGGHGSAEHSAVLDRQMIMSGACAALSTGEMTNALQTSYRVMKLDNETGRSFKLQVSRPRMQGNSASCDLR